MIRPPFLLVFDLDDTLYLERDFVFSGFRAVGDYVLRQTGVAGFEVECRRLFEAGVRRTIFDAALLRVGREPERAFVARLVGVYRSHRPAIMLAPDAQRYLAGAGTGHPFALITDGPAATQAAKVAALALDRAIDEIILTDTLGPGCGKPHPAAFAKVEACAGVDADRLVYVGDNALKDFVTPRARGWLTVSVARPGRVHFDAPPDAGHAAHAGIESLDELDATLARLAGRRRSKVAGALRRDAAVVTQTMPAYGAGREA